MKQLEQLLKEKWFLVAADALVVIGILSLGLDPSDGFQAALAVLGILAASLIVLLPVLREDAGGKRRLAEQARLRAALAEEIDRLREDMRASLEAAGRRSLDAELAAKKVAEASAEGVARKASAELAALRAQVAATAEGIEELRGPIQSAADVARAAAADVETALEQAESAAAGLAELRGKSAADHQAAQAALQKLAADLAAGRAALADLESKVDALRANPSEASAPAPEVAARDLEPEAVEAREGEIEDIKDTEDAEEAEDTKETEETEDAEETEEVEETEDEDAVEVEEPVPEPLAAEAGAEEAAPEPEPEPVAFVKTVMASESDAEGTCLIANLMIGIGNKPFVRGTGPGLSETAGVPMQFLAIGRWLWRSPDGSQSATVQVWKNDQAPLGEAVHVRAGETRELEEDFFAG